jgi:hypothetical protein
MQMSSPKRLWGYGFNNTHVTPFTTDHIYLGSIERALTVGEHNLSTFGEAQHSKSMSRLLLRKLERGSNIRGIK